MAGLIKEGPAIFGSAYCIFLNYELHPTTNLYKFLCVDTHLFNDVRIMSCIYLDQIQIKLIDI